MRNRDKSGESDLQLVQEIPPNRTIFLRCNLTNEVAERIKFNLNEIQQSDGDILVIFDTPGGHFKAGKILYDCFRTSRQRVVGKVEGFAASAGFMALQGCSLRLATKYSTLHIHDTVFRDLAPLEVKHSTKLAEYMKWQHKRFREIKSEVTRNHQVTIEILLKVSTFKTASEIEEFLDKELVMDPTSAIQYGFLDKVL